MTKDLKLEYVDSLQAIDYGLLYCAQKQRSTGKIKNFIPFFVPAGYIDLRQHLDVSIMKPLKSKIRIFYDD